MFNVIIDIIQFEIIITCYYSVFLVTEQFVALHLTFLENLTNPLTRNKIKIQLIYFTYLGTHERGN